MIHLKNNRGVTLVELLVGITVLSIITAAIVSLLSTSLSLTNSGIIKNNLLQEGRWTLDIIGKELNCIDMKSVSNPSPGMSSNTLTFTSFNTANNVTYTVPNDTVEVHRLNRPLTDGQRASVQPTGLVFTRSSDNTSIDISITLTQTDAKHVLHTETIKTTVTPLNTNN